MICPSCKSVNDDAAEACFTCGRALGALTQGSLIANRYEVVSPLGRGGMGMVYKAHDRMLEEDVAIKVLRAELSSTPEMAQRFRHEIKLARKVSHRNACRYHEYGEDGGVRFISMEFVEGLDLRQAVRERGGLLPIDEAFDIAIQSADGLQAIHEVGLVHRDLKTSNIMRDPRGVVRLMDFGIAKTAGADRTGGGLTTTGQIMGTPEYMSPEQCVGEKIDHRSDVYSLGIVIYELFTGQVPFRGDTPVATLFKHIQDQVPFEGPVAGRIPLAAVKVLRRALAKDRADRFDNAAAMTDALREAQLMTASGAQEDALPTSGMPAVTPAGSMTPLPGGPMTPGPLTPAPRGALASGPLTPPPTPVERRRVTRLDIFVNFVLRREGTLGTVLQEERTIAENVGRGGARVMTTMTSLESGDVVSLEEVGGPFKTRAEVKGTYVGKDNIRRLNLHFLDSPAPDYLVFVDESGPKS